MILPYILMTIWAASSEFGTYRLCEQRRFRRACASAQSHQNLRYSLIQAVSQEEPSDRKPDPWPLWMAAHAQLKFVMKECSKTQIRLARPIWCMNIIIWDYESVRPKVWPQNKYRSLWPVFNCPVIFALHLEDFLMYEHYTWGLWVIITWRLTSK